MQIKVSGKQIDIGASLTEYVKDAIEKSVSKYFDRAINANVVFSKEKHLSCADIVVNDGTGVGPVIKGNGKATEIYVAFDEALSRIEKQLRRYKRKIKDHHKEKINGVSTGGMKYIIDGRLEEEAQDNPLIIAEKSSSIDTLSVSDAVMHMDLADLPALTFINEKTKTVSVVYHRKDGNISWVDSKVKAS